MQSAGSSLAAFVRDHNRRIIGEALLTLGIGVGSCLIIFGVIYWLAFLAFTMCFRGFAWGGPSMMAGAITGVFLLASVWSAWRGVDPIAEADIVVDDSPGRELEDALAFSMGVPVLRRDGLAGIGSLLIGGPANVFDAFALWRTRLPCSAALVAEADALLRSCAAGVNPKQVRTPEAIALLYRLKLIKASHRPGGELLLQQTQKGTEVAAIGVRREPRDR